VMRELIERRIEEASKGAWNPKMGIDGWKLYTPESKSDISKTDKAVDSLNSAMGKYKKALRKDLAKIAEYDTKVVGPVAGALYDSIIDPVHSKYRSVGADDTPVREISVIAAIQMIKDVYGKTGWTKLGDYIG